MKHISIILKVFLSIFSVVLAIFSLLMLIIEARMLFTFEFVLSDNIFSGFIRCLFRMLIALFALGVGITEIVNLKLKNNTIGIYLYIGNVCLFLRSIFILILTTNYIGYVCIGLSVLLLAIKSILVFVIKETKLIIEK